MDSFNHIRLPPPYPSAPVVADHPATKGETKDGREQGREDESNEGFW